LSGSYVGVKRLTRLPTTFRGDLSFICWRPVGSSRELRSPVCLAPPSGSPLHSPHCERPKRSYAFLLVGLVSAGLLGSLSDPTFLSVE